jgi:hypothetical protein
MRKYNLVLSGHKQCLSHLCHILNTKTRGYSNYEYLYWQMVMKPHSMYGISFCFFIKGGFLHG